MEYVFQELDKDTGIIAIQSASPFIAGSKPVIARVYPTALGSAEFANGTVLGKVEGKLSGLILIVRKHDLIVIRESSPHTSSPCWLYYRINDRFEPALVRRQNQALTGEELRPLIEIAITGPGPRIDSSDELLGDFLCGKRQPDWLESIVASQVRHWRLTKPEKLFRLAHSRVTDEEIPLGIKIAPFFLLAHLGDRLTPIQRGQCARRSLVGAVMFAFEELSPGRVDQAIMKIPNIVMRFAAGMLNDEEFRLCLSIHPFSAYQIRMKLSALRRAMALAASYPYGFLDGYGGDLPSLQEEIIRSIGEFPREWLAAHDNDYGKMFDLLHSSVDLKITPALISRILNETPEEFRDPIARFCAASF